MGRSENPIGVVGDPVHNFELTGLPVDDRLLFLFGRRCFHGLDHLAVTEDLPTGVPDRKIAFRPFIDLIAARLNQHIMAALIFIFHTRL